MIAGDINFDNAVACFDVLVSAGETVVCCGFGMMDATTIMYPIIQSPRLIV